MEFLVGIINNRLLLGISFYRRVNRTVTGDAAVFTEGSSGEDI